MKSLLMLIGIFMLALSLRAQVAGQQITLESANQSYASSDFALAAEQYESVIASGFEAPGLYFNLGNAYFKLNNIPAAILYYEKARKLDPTDENIRFNLELANSKIIDKIEPLPEFFLRTWWRSARDNFSSDQWTRAGVAGFITALIFIALFIISKMIAIRKFSFWAAVVFIVLMSLSFLFGYSSYREYSEHDTAIIFTPTVTVKSSPNENSVDLFVIHEGAKVFITDKVEEWSEVRLANGNIGWVKDETFRLI